MRSCHACKKQLELGREIGRRDECPFCRADLHCCLNCRFYDASAPRQCREPQSVLVREKAKANFCDFFVFADRTAGPGGDPDKARKALDDLFRI
ncbi:MAG: hypothetical protein OEW15_18030 [Nitrospirota bacterium]|nr:hypothetical protein [Nitrospirota bacterium]